MDIENENYLGDQTMLKTKRMTIEMTLGGQDEKTATYSLTSAPSLVKAEAPWAWWSPPSSRLNIFTIALQI